MTKIELLELLIKEAKKFRKEQSFISTNSHLTGIESENMPSSSQIDGILIGFINYIGLHQCIDYALSYEDLNKEKK